MSVNAFVVGCIKLRGLAKSMDVMDLLVSARRSADEQKRFAVNCDAKFDELKQMVDSLSSGRVVVPGNRPPIAARRIKAVGNAGVAVCKMQMHGQRVGDPGD